MTKYIFGLAAALCLLPGIAAGGTLWSAPDGTDANIVGHVVDRTSGQHMPFVTVALRGTTIGTVTDRTGHYYLKNLPQGDFVLVVSSIGYRSVSHNLTLTPGQTVEMNFELEEDAVALDAVVVSANRSETARREAPTLVRVISPELFEATNSHNLSEVLCFQPGVRVENDCQNCGYTQVRINGMEGKYTQILIDSRPVFSALAGVYGLEQIPASMVERVEVVRGGGSALFGSSAIAGTVNIITREPVRNSGLLSHTVASVDASSKLDNNTGMNLAFVSDDSRMGAYVYAQNRHRSAWDANGDGFSELAKIRSQTMGINGYCKTGTYSKLGLEYHHLEEFRRGGSMNDLPPHIAEDAELNGTGEDGLVEQIEHSINAGGLNFALFAPDGHHTLSLYASAQDIRRQTYYSAYGSTTDLTAVAGAQYIYSFDRCLFMPADLTAGAEYNYDRLRDKSTDVQKYRDAALAENPDADPDELQALIDKYTPEALRQTVRVTSAYLQNEWKTARWSLLVGGRVDHNSLMRKAIFSPRANVRFDPARNVNLRLSYAEGFRAAQAFDEDLHISHVGGELLAIRLDDDLREERSRSVNASADVYAQRGRMQANLLVEAFFTRLTDPFVLTAPVADEATGYLIQTRTNGSGAKVCGLTAEGRIALADKAELQAGITMQRSRYDRPEEWSADADHLTHDARQSRRMMRTPDVYGYFTLGISPLKRLSIALDGNATGRMLVPHLLSEVDGSADELRHAPRFVELGLKAGYDIDLDCGLCLQLNAGVRNLADSYQDDFDRGPGRDSGYIYGPTTPRTLFAGLRLSF